MQEVTKEKYIQSIMDFETLYLIEIENNKVFLKSDIECGGDIGLRTEIMNFKLDTSLTFRETCSECRSHYTGGIQFIEYDSYDDAKLSVIDDFLNLSPQSIYLICEDKELQAFTTKYNNQSVYILIQ